MHVWGGVGGPGKRVRGWGAGWGGGGAKLFAIKDNVFSGSLALFEARGTVHSSQLAFISDVT